MDFCVADNTINLRQHIKGVLKEDLQKEAVMYQCNLIIVKSDESGAFLEKRGYQLDWRNEWKAYSYWRRSYKDSMVGSKSQVFQKEGKYPYELSAMDYKRAIRKESDFYELALLKQKEEGFVEKARQLWEYSFREKSLEKRVRELDWRDDLTKDEDIELDQCIDELSRLDREIDKLEKDKVFLCAYCYLGLGKHDVRMPEKLREKQRLINSSNYNMREYRYYRRIFSRLLKYDSCIYFTYQDEEERKDFTLVKELPLNELRIGDLAMLCSNDVLKICR